MKILIALSLIAFFLCIRLLTDTFPTIFACVLKWRESLHLDFNVKQSRNRDILFAVLLVPASLLITNYLAYFPDFLSPSTEIVQFLYTLAGILILMILRLFLQKLLSSRKIEPQAYAAAYSLFKTIFIFNALVCLLLAGVLYVLAVPDESVGTALLWVSGALYALLLLRKGQILSQSLSVFSTILYLCGLEIAPLIIVISPSIFL